MPMSPFLAEVDRRVLVCDGAMGTMLYGKGIFLNRSFDELNLTQPDLVAEVHQAYVRAGADVVETNTFGANRIKLGAFSLAERVHAINLQGARIARHAAREQAFVAGAIGPLGIRIEPWGKTGVDEAEEYFAEQARALAEGGVDLFILETFRDVNEIGAAIRAVRSVCALPIVAQVTTEEDGNSLDGAAPETFVPELERLGADLVGLNCSVGPAAMLETIERMAHVATVKLSAQPNAGRPREIEGRNIYLCSPEYMASYARRFIANDVRLVGGCCGTTPEHIRHIKNAVRAMAPVTARTAVTAPSAKAPEAAVAPVPRGEKSRLANCLERGHFVVTVELLPPRGFRADALVEQARQLRIRGVDLINIPDARRASARMSALSAALLVQQQAGVETVLHYACRDRNLLGMQSDLLGAHSMGIRNLLIITGDPPRVGDYPDATAVFDVDSIGLTNVVTRLNRGLDIAGQGIGHPTAFHVGVAINQGALDLEEEIRRFQYKVEAGAEFAITQPVFDARELAQFLERVAAFRIPVIAGVTPLESVRHAEFMANELPGVHVPDATVERMRRAEAAGQAAAEGLAIAREVVSEIRPLVQGLQIATAGGSVEAALAVIEAVAV
ncbi:MAG: bifunctional homocysteine S-methyltransferase/methylenetetrahydrofolate reductase [Acidobacteria bacterium RIFCSPLOWO2_02_FULL_67_36]|nr:MAG: bifunctional homocysteine S-methyltransferase/methylenetetrahydrofolate reductase [Acidobacteria bacterium RIFCSPLOWO2_02_FULL_67_36]OFW26351.1 MAG: bifunctional homocysteine S-methyltransferase/methylenetetrahydrofolate reductase [Acidobacteria bacterium RIFCSPLOWO2_12_FULL_66_21]